jgi:hypothetical protein
MKKEILKANTAFAKLRVFLDKKLVDASVAGEHRLMIEFSEFKHICDTKTFEKMLNRVLTHYIELDAQILYQDTETKELTEDCDLEFTWL